MCSTSFFHDWLNDCLPTTFSSQINAFSKKSQPFSFRLRLFVFVHIFRICIHIKLLFKNR